MKILTANLVWYSVKVFNFIYATMTNTLFLEGSTAPRGLKADDLASAEISYTEGGLMVLRVTLKSGEIFNLHATKNNVAVISHYVKIYRLDENLEYQEFFYSVETLKLKPF